MNIEDENNEDGDEVEVVFEDPLFMAVVHPGDRNRRPGLIRVSSRMKGPKCKTCKGGGLCFHLRVI